jgi:sialidase-1
LLFFSNPASTKRERMTVRASTDGGVTWPNAVELYGGPSAYSDLVFLNETTVACVYERGTQGAYEEIVVTRITLDRLAPEAGR